MYIYCDGKILQDTEPAILSADRGLLLGDGIFETLKIINNKPIFLQEHVDRLLKACELMAIPANQIHIAEIEKILSQLIEINKLAEQTASARITLTRGVGPRGLLPPKETVPTLLITVAPYVGMPEKTFSLWVSSIKRNEHSLLSQIKSLCYLENIIAKMEAEKHGADDALILNTQGFVASTSICNIFMVKNNMLITPPISDGALPGIIRNKIFQIAKMPLQEKSITLEELCQADGIFITNSLIGIQSVSRVNQKPIALQVEWVRDLRQGLKERAFFP